MHVDVSSVPGEDLTPVAVAVDHFTAPRPSVRGDERRDHSPDRKLSSRRIRDDGLDHVWMRRGLNNLWDKFPSSNLDWRVNLLTGVRRS